MTLKRLMEAPRLCLRCVWQYLRYGFWAKEFHYNCAIESPLELNGIKNIALGRGVKIKKNAFISVLPLTGSKSCQLVIGDKSNLNFGCHVIATRNVSIGECCNIAPYVYIADNMHGFEDINTPPKFQKIKQLQDVIIGNETWIGTKACIIGCKIGKHCVIGANTIVKKDVPDYCVVGGIPARIIKRYDFERCEWRRTDKDGNFIEQ